MFRTVAGTTAWQVATMASVDTDHAWRAPLALLGGEAIGDAVFAGFCVRGTRWSAWVCFLEVSAKWRVCFSSLDSVRRPCPHHNFSMQCNAVRRLSAALVKHALCMDVAVQHHLECWYSGRQARNPSFLQQQRCTQVRRNLATGRTTADGKDPSGTR